MTAGLTGRDPNVNVLRRFRCIYGTCNAILLFTSSKKSRLRLLVESSYIKTNGLFQYQTRTTAWFDTYFQNALREPEYYVKNIM